MWRFRFPGSIQLKWPKVVLATVSLLTVVVFVRLLFTPDTNHWTGNIDGKYRFKTMLGFNHTGRSKPRILVWSTTHFYDEQWFEWTRKALLTCPNDCDFTTDKSYLPSSDAVLFHLQDISWKRFWINIIMKDVKANRFSINYKFPEYRTPNQVWVLFNWEPKVKIWSDFSKWDGLFNWTYMYNTESDIVFHYGRITALSGKERSEAIKDGSVRRKSWMAGKDRMILSMISNCHDAARRYRIRQELARYIDIDSLGLCGGTCPNCDKHINEYKFYLALENSDCKDYLTEKFWDTLEREQIPIVAWKLPMTHLVPPHSYINVYDFPSFRDAADYIKKVANNESLYNSYFHWKESYRLGGEHHVCQLCRKLTTGGHPGQVYTDLTGWLSNDTSSCPLETMSTWVHQLWDKFTFDLGLGGVS